MHTEADGPRTHLVLTEEHLQRERMADVFELIKRGQTKIDAEKRSKQKLLEQSDAVQRRHVDQANAIAERFAWNAVASVILFEVQVCEHCLAEHKAFRGFGTVFRRKADALERTTRAACLDSSLSPLVRETHTNVPCCSACLPTYLKVYRTPDPQAQFLNLRKDDPDAPV